MELYHPSKPLVCGVRLLPLHQRKRGSRRPYARPTHWLASAFYIIVVEPTRRQAIAELRKRVAALPS